MTTPGGSDMQVRRATDDDVGEIQQLGRRTLDASYAPLLGQVCADHQYDIWWTRDALQRSLRRSVNLVATAGEGTIVGVATLGERDGKPVLWKLYVLPEYHGLGVGTRLIAAAEAHAPAGAVALRLEYVDGNEPAAGFYRAKGFREVAREPDPDGWPDEIWMERPIEPSPLHG
ncbi:MAG: GNAT family N-acetyltransferase [Nocardioidaceae bacterium]